MTGLLFVGVNAIVKHLDNSVPAAEAAFLRYVLGLIFLVPIIGKIWNARLSRGIIILFGLRGIVHACAVILWFYAMARIPIVEVTSMNFLHPIYVTIGAALFLHEKLAARRILAICLSVLGIMIILRPGFRELSSGHIAMLVSALFFGASYLFAKVLSGLISPSIIVGMLSITVMLSLAPFAFAVWVTPTWYDIAWLFVVAAFATAAHYTMTLAFRAAPISLSQPVVFLQLVWAAMLDAIVFSLPIDGWVIVGGTIIVASVSYISWRETVVGRKKT